MGGRPKAGNYWFQDQGRHRTGRALAETGFGLAFLDWLPRSVFSVHRFWGRETLLWRFLWHRRTDLSTHTVRWQPCAYHRSAQSLPCPWHPLHQPIKDRLIETVPKRPDWSVLPESKLRQCRTRSRSCHAILISSRVCIEGIAACQTTSKPVISKLYASSVRANGQWNDKQIRHFPRGRFDRYFSNPPVRYRTFWS